MQHIAMGLTNIAQKPHKAQISNAGGLLLVSPQSFANFMADLEHTKYLHAAITAGLQAAKTTSEVFALCYQIPLQGIDIQIYPTDSIYTDTLQYHTKFLPSFNPKHFKLKQYSTAIETPKTETPKMDANATTQSRMRMRFKQAKAQFQDAQFSNYIKPAYTNKECGHCGFEVKVSINANAPIPPIMESMHALHATLLSLFGIFKHDDMAVITQIRILEA